MTLKDFNKLNRGEAVKAIQACCGSAKFTSLLMERFPFTDETALMEAARQSWYGKCGEAEWLEAFACHPKIGDVKSLAEKFAGKEQAAVAGASAAVLDALSEANKAYEQKFGFIFIVCATGKSADEMLRLLDDRLGNSRKEELQIAMGEQYKITVIRFKKMIDEAKWNEGKASQVTTHVLDTTLGKPGKDITIRLKHNVNGEWETISQGVTNSDGRIGDLLPPGLNLVVGNYKMVFDTGKYFSMMKMKGFYPVVEIDFSVFDNSHYHVPLLINPFGYSTYRGS